MESKKISAATITKPVAQIKAKGKSAAVNDEKASLVRASMLPAFMQRKTVAMSEEEKEKKLLAIQRLKSQQQQVSGYKNIDVR